MSTTDIKEAFINAIDNNCAWGIMADGSVSFTLPRESEVDNKNFKVELTDSAYVISSTNEEEGTCVSILIPHEEDALVFHAMLEDGEMSIFHTEIVSKDSFEAGRRV